MRNGRDGARSERDEKGDAPALVFALVEPLGPGDDHARDADDEVEEHVGRREVRVLVEAVVLRSCASQLESTISCALEERERTVDPATEAAMSPLMPT